MPRKLALLFDLLTYIKCSFALIQWFTLFIRASGLIVSAVFLTLASAFYTLAALKHQEFTSSSTLGGHGLAQQII